MVKVVSIFLFAVLLVSPVLGQDIAQHLQDISVTINSSAGSGSGVVITREVKLKKDSDVTAKVNFVWTAAHVVDGLRNVRTVIDPVTGQERKLVEYAPVAVVKELVEDGRKVGETRMEGRVIKYSDADSRHDLALIMLHKKNFIDTSAEFYLDDAIPAIGTSLFHVGSLLGQSGSNSMTTGIISQVGRTVNLDGTNVAIFDQTTVTAFPGSSGGGVFLADGPNKGKYVGMLVRGAGETFNLIVPARRLKSFATEHNLLWALDKNVPAPTLEEILASNIEDVRVESNSSKAAAADSQKKFPFLFHKNFVLNKYEAFLNNDSFDFSLQNDK
jgi:hypothetical protein